MAILLGFGKIILKTLINIFPLNVFEEIGGFELVGDDAYLEKVGDSGVAEIVSPVTTIVVAHDGTGLWVVGDCVVLIAATRVDFGPVVLDVDTTVGDATESFVDFNDGR